MEENQNYQTPYSNNNSDMSDSFLKVMVEVEETLQKFEMETLRRKRLVVDLRTKTKNWEPMAKGVGEVCNELGISEILGMMRGRGTVIGRLTKKTDEEIMKDMFQFHRAMIELFSLRADDWKLDEELAKPLLEACISLIQDIVFSARGGFTAINLRTQYSRHEQANATTNENEGNSILGMKIR